MPTHGQEYYMDGVGWIPFEVTPGYIDEDELLETAAAVSDGMGDGTGNTFRQNPLKYAPPEESEGRTAGAGRKKCIPV